MHNSFMDLYISHKFIYSDLEQTSTEKNRFVVRIFSIFLAIIVGPTHMSPQKSLPHLNTRNSSLIL